MPKYTFIAAVLVAALVMGACPATSRAGVTREQIEKIVDQLIANGESWAKDEAIKNPVNLKGLKIDKASASVVGSALRGIQLDEAGAYAAARLMEKIQTCDAETLEAMLPAVRMVLTRAGSLYRPFPRMSQAQIAALNMPAYSERLSTDAIMTRMSQIAELRAAKVARDMPVAKRNKAAWDIEKAGYQIVALVGSSLDDRRSITNMIRAENVGDAMFTVIANAYIAAAPKMEPSRAARLYTVLRPQVARLLNHKKKNYSDKGECKLESEAPSTFGTSQDYPGIRLGTLFNKLADAAKDPRYQKIKVPTGGQIDQIGRKKKKK